MILSSPFVITISRQLGSGGAYVGQRLAKTLNIFYADREIINQAAKKFSLIADDLESRDEKMSSFWQSCVQSYAVGFPDAYVMPQILATDSSLFRVEMEIIEHIAKEQSAVIIGRCGSYILRKHPNHVSIFLHSDITFRLGRIQKLYNLSEEAAGKIITQSDKERAAYNYSFTGKEWTDARQYNISIDTSKMGLDKSVELILKYLEYNEVKE
jgi:CMP/dCMP kinase